ncbi:unnamed protein product, partial [Rotaria sp. Silwood1]
MDERASSSFLQSTEHLSSSLSPAKPVITKTKSNKGKLMLVINGYNFGCG